MSLFIVADLKSHYHADDVTIKYGNSAKARVCQPAAKTCSMFIFYMESNRDHLDNRLDG